MCSLEAPTRRRRQPHNEASRVKWLTLGERKKGCFSEVREEKASLRWVPQLSGIAPNQLHRTGKALCVVEFGKNAIFLCFSVWSPEVARVF